MARQYSGSKSSPIVIEDSDEEVIHQLCHELTDTPPPSRSFHLPNIRPEHTHPNMGTGDTRDGYPLNSNGSVKTEDNQLHRKRKRSEPGPSYFVASAPGPSPTRKVKPYVLETKKARKRRRKLEREALEAHQQLPYDEGTALSMQIPSGQQWPMINPAVYQGIPDSRAHQYMRNAPGLAAAMPTQYRPQPLVYPPGLYDVPAASTSSWVARMAMAAESPDPTLLPWDHMKPATQRFPPVHPVVPVTDAGSSSSSGHLATTRVSTIIPPPPAHLPTKPREPIGMMPEQDPHGKHGFFDTSPSSLSNCFTSTPYRPKNYSPSPARTLVMDQISLHKSLRTLDYVKSWCATACGSQPVYIAVDLVAKKALMEFATVDLARKAWSSPKPRPKNDGAREDLIKVWWFRGPEPAVGEIEEGEIEDDSAKKPPSAPPRKETKKERKARLARERLASRSNDGKSGMRPVAPPKSSKQPTPVQPIGVQSTPPIIHPYPPLRPTLASVEQNFGWSELQNPYASTSYRSSYGSSLKPADSATKEDRESIASSSGSPPRFPSPADPPPDSMTREAFVIPVDPIQDPEEMVVDTEPRPHADSGYDSAPLLDQYSLGSRATCPSLPLNAPIPRFGQFPTSAPIQPPQQSSPLSIPNSTLPTPAPTPPQGATSHPIPAQSSPPPDPGPPAVATSVSPVPSPAPSEPRAMKNVPKGPSFAKRSLLARQKELEEIIQKTKVQLEPKSRQTSRSRASSPLSDLTPISIGTPSTPIIDGAASDTSDKEAMEGRLRKLVLESQKTKNKASSSDETASPAVCPPDVAPPPDTTSDGDKSSPPLVTPIVLPSPSTDPPKISFDELAISFITETIQTITSKSPPSAPLQEIQVTKVPTSNATIKLELAAKQKQLEQQIADSKILMAKLAAARTKQEKNSILAAMREKTRVTEHHQNAPSPADTHRSNQQNETSVAPADPGQRRWPDCDHSSGVFIMISDDESGDSDGE